MTQHSPRSLRILVVDDEELICISIRMLLKSDGHVVTIARSGEEALRIFKESLFDLVLTDYSMSGMKGTELAAAIKATAPSCPVVMITAYAQMLPAVLPSVDRIISKPFKREELRQAIDEVSQVV
jgi:CheY-like chemotaxis protein